MAGILDFRQSILLSELGNLPSINSFYSISGLDEASYRVDDIAAEGTVTVDVGAINTVQFVAWRVITGGTTAATGISIDLSTATWAATDFVLLQGELVGLRPALSTMSIKNLHTSTVAKVEYIVVGDNA